MLNLFTNNFKDNIMENIKKQKTTIIRNVMRRILFIFLLPIWVLFTIIIGGIIALPYWN